MENRVGRKDYSHYNHTDTCKHSRWTAQECYRFMYDRPWQHVLDFYQDVVNGCMMVSDLFGIRFVWYQDLLSQTACSKKDAEIVVASDKSELVTCTIGGRTGRWERVTFKIVLSYYGNSFDGWQKQAGLNTVQGLVEGSLGDFIDEKKAKQLKEKGLPTEGHAIVAGRTDKGVTAIQQVCSFYTWRKDVSAQDIEDAINRAAIGKLRVFSVVKVSRDFHPNFSAKWRRYLYIFPFKEGEQGKHSCSTPQNMEKGIDVNDSNKENGSGKNIDEESGAYQFENDKETIKAEKPTTFTVERINQLLSQIEGKLLSYKMFSRDTQASRSIGPPTECFIFHARATELTLPRAGENYQVMCIELVANRFLRKMVRVLVATAIREAACGAEEDALLKLMDATCRRATAPPAPPHGLSLVDVGYSEFNRQRCLIP